MKKKCQTGNKNYYSNEYLLPAEPLFRTSTSEKYHDTFFIVILFFLSLLLSTFSFILSFVTSSLPSHNIFHNFIFHHHHHHSIIYSFFPTPDPIFRFVLVFMMARPMPAHNSLFASHSMALTTLANSFRLEHDYDYKHLNFSLASSLWNSPS